MRRRARKRLCVDLQGQLVFSHLQDCSGGSTSADGVTWNPCAPQPAAHDPIHVSVKSGQLRLSRTKELAVILVKPASHFKRLALNGLAHVMLCWDLGDLVRDQPSEQSFTVFSIDQNSGHE
jgi:hypothetical protein